MNAIHLRKLHISILFKIRLAEKNHTEMKKNLNNLGT